MLPHLIHADQTGFLKGRYIGENIRLINDLMEQTNATKIPNLQNSTKIFYNDVESTILNNDFATNWVKPTRGVRQGFPLSPFLFVLSAELMANKIRQSHLIKGVTLFGNEIKLSQNKFGLTRTNFLQFYQVIHAIPKNLVSKALATKLCSNSSELESNSTLFDLEPEVKLNLTTMKSREFYSLFINNSYAEEQTGVTRWNKIVTMDKKSWQSAFTSVRTTSKDMILREFHFKFLHRMTVTKKELFRFGLKADCACLY